MDVKCFQLMRCIFCYTSSLLITNAETQAKKIVRMELLLKKNMFICRPLYDYKNVEKEVNNLLKDVEKQSGKKIFHVNRTIIFNFFVTKYSYKKDDV